MDLDGDRQRCRDRHCHRTPKNIHSGEETKYVFVFKVFLSGLFRLQEVFSIFIRSALLRLKLLQPMLLFIANVMFLNDGFRGQRQISDNYMYDRSKFQDFALTKTGLGESSGELGKKSNLKNERVKNKSMLCRLRVSPYTEITATEVTVFHQRTSQPANHTYILKEYLVFKK